MNLLFFLGIATLLSVTLGELGKFPFGGGGVAITLSDIILSLLMFFSLIWVFGVKKIKKINVPLPVRFLVTFIVIGLVSLILSAEFSGIFYLIRFVLYAFAFIFFYSLIKSQQNYFNQIINIIIISGVIIAISGFLQLIIMPDLEVLSDFGFDPHKGRLVSTFLDPNFAGSFLNITLLLSLFVYIQQRKKLYIFIIGILLTAIILTFSRSAYLMLIIQSGALLFFKERRIFIVGVIVLLLSVLFIPRVQERVAGALTLDQTSKERIESWQRGVVIFQQNPIFGVGFNNLRVAQEKLNSFETNLVSGGHSGAGVDSSFLFILTTTGILGFLSFIGFLASIFLKALKNIKIQNDLFSLVIISLIIGVIINSQFINSLFFPPIMLAFFALLGMFSARTIN